MRPATRVFRPQVLGISRERSSICRTRHRLDPIRLGGPETTTLREDPIAVAAELDPTTRLTFGKSLGPDVELTFSQSLRNGDAQTWIVDYLPVRGIELRLVSDDQDLRSYGFRHDVAFGGPFALFNAHWFPATPRARHEVRYR